MTLVNYKFFKMTVEKFLEIQKLFGMISSTKGCITKLLQRIDRTNDIFKKEDLEAKLKEKVLLLEDLKKQFKEM